MVQALQIQALQIPKRSFRPEQADVFPSFVRERVGLRREVNGRCDECKRHKYKLLQIPKRSFRPGAGRRFFPSFVRERVGLRSGGISLRSLASQAQIFHVTVRLTFPFRFPHQSYKCLFPVARRNFCVPVNLIRLRIWASLVRTRRLAW